MLKSYIILLFLLILISRSKADWYEIDLYNKVPAVSKIAKTGKVSVFIISTSWCTPCHILKEALKQQNYDMTKVDIYYINMSPLGYTLSDLRKTESFNMWIGIENLESWPTIYITSQTTNIKAIFNSQGDDKDLVTRINRITNDLLEKNQYFNKKLVLTYDSMNHSVTHDFINKVKDSILKINDVINVTISKLTDSINYQKNTLILLYDSINAINREKYSLKKMINDTIFNLNEINDSILLRLDSIAFKLEFLQKLRLNADSIQSYKIKKNKKKCTKNHFLTSSISVKLLANFISEDTAVPYTIKIKTKHNSNYIKINENLELFVNLINGNNYLSFKVDFMDYKDKYYELEIFKYGVLLIKSELNYKK